MARVYATQEDYQAWSGDETAEVSPMVLARASLDLDEALIGAWYSVNGEGMPVDGKIITALKEATCAQVHATRKGQAAGGDGIPGKVTSASIGGASYTIEAGPDPDEIMDNGLSRSANSILRVEGLLPVHVITRG